MHNLYNFKESVKRFEEIILPELDYNNLSDSLLWAHSYIIRANQSFEEKSDLLLLVGSWISKEASNKARKELIKKIKEL